jgi:hypothetical protein
MVWIGNAEFLNSLHYLFIQCLRNSLATRSKHLSKLFFTGWQLVLTPPALQLTSAAPQCPLCTFNISGSSSRCTRLAGSGAVFLSGQHRFLLLPLECGNKSSASPDFCDTIPDTRPFSNSWWFSPDPCEFP